MKKLWIGLLLLVVIMTATASGPVGTVASPCLSIGGMNVFDCSDLIVLYCSVDGTAGGNNNCTFRKGTATVGTGYQITAAKTFKAYGAKVRGDTAGNSDAVAIGYGDNDIGTTNGTPRSGTVPTNVKFLGTNSSSSDLVGPFFPSTSNGLQETPFFEDFTIPATKYPCLQGAGARKISVQLFGHEV